MKEIFSIPLDDQNDVSWIVYNFVADTGYYECLGEALMRRP